MFVITGGSSGIGRNLAWELANRDKPVLIIGRRQKELNETAKHSSLIQVCCADVSTTQGREAIKLALQSEEKIQGLVHNAGIIEPITPVKNIKESDWLQVFATNLHAPLLLSQILLPQLIGGRVLHIGSGAAYFPVSGWAAYCTSKAALSMLTRCWQLECSSTAFTSVMPGIIDTDMQAVIRNSQNMEQDKLDFFKTLHNEKKLVSAEVVALFLSWLLLDMDSKTYSSKEWDIYDGTHHPAWLVPPHQVPTWEEN